MSEVREQVVTTEELAIVLDERKWVREPNDTYSNKYGITVARECGNCWRILLPDSEENYG